MESTSDKPIYHLSPVDLLIMLVSWVSTQLSNTIAQLVGHTMKVEDVKVFVEMLQPVLTFLTVFFVFMTALVRYKQAKKQLNNEQKPKEDGDNS